MEDIFVSSCLKLSLVNPRFAEEAFATVNQNRELLQAWLPWAKDTTSIDDELAYFSGSLKRFEEGKCVEMAIFERQSENKSWKFIGMCGLVNIVQRAREGEMSFAEIGYWLDKAYHGKGVVTACCTKLIEVAFIQLNIDKLKIVAHKDNAPSVAVAKRLGFYLTEEKLLRPNPIFHDNRHPENALIFALSKVEWEERKCGMAKPY